METGMGKKLSRRLSSSHLLHEQNGCLFRVTVPPDVRPFLQRREVRYCLKTRLLGEAKRRARRMFVCAERFFEDIRQMEKDVKLTGAELLIILRDGLKESFEQAGVRSLADIEQDRGLRELSEHPGAQPLRDILKDSYLGVIEQADIARLARPVPESQTEQDVQQRELAKLRESLQSDLSLRNYSQVYSLLDQLLAKRGISLDSDSAAYESLCKFMLENLIAAIAILYLVE